MTMMASTAACMSARVSLENIDASMELRAVGMEYAIPLTT